MPEPRIETLVPSLPGECALMPGWWASTSALLDKRLSAYGYVDDVAGAGYALQRIARLRAGIGSGDLHRIQRGGLRSRGGDGGEAEGYGQKQQRRGGAVRRERHAGML